VSHLCLSVANVPLPGHTETFAFLFDMNQLFGEFIAEFARRELQEDSLFDVLRRRCALAPAPAGWHTRRR
jgi:hypothetical protein